MKRIHVNRYIGPATGRVRRVGSSIGCARRGGEPRPRPGAAVRRVALVAEHAGSALSEPAVPAAPVARACYNPELVEAICEEIATTDPQAKSGSAVVRVCSTRERFTGGLTPERVVSPDD